MRGCIKNTNNNNGFSLTATADCVADSTIKQDYSGFTVAWTANGAAGAAGVGALLVAALIALSA